MKNLIFVLLLFFAGCKSEKGSRSAPETETAIYGIAPWYFSDVSGNRLKAIEKKLPEIAELGVSTLWLQPVYNTHDGYQAYDVTDYFSVWRELGSENDLKNLIKKAHSLNLKVIFDFVANHTSIEHPFVKDIQEKGKESRYYDYYMHEKDNSPYSESQNVLTLSGIPFVYYFWDRLLNLNFSNLELREHLMSAAEYWVKEFDVDGYRFDASWGPNARSPDFFNEMSDRLRKIKKVTLLAEDKPFSEAYRNSLSPHAKDVFDLAYDWNSDREYISMWSWQTESHAETIFNSVEANDRASQLAEAIEGNLTEGSEARILRFLENNDTPRFRENHSIEMFKLATVLQFTLPGVPLIYYGQEVGTEERFPTYGAVKNIKTLNPTMWSFYQKLLHLRGLPAFAEGEFNLIESNGAFLSFERVYQAHGYQVHLNLGEEKLPLSFPCQIVVSSDSAPKAGYLKPLEARVCE